MKKNTISEFSKTASYYDRAERYNNVRQDYLDVLNEVCSENFNTLLDCGCGTGAFIDITSNKLPENRYLGVDIIPKMIEIAKNKHIPNTNFILGDIETMDFPDGSIDVVTCIHSFHHFTCPTVFFEKMKSALVNNGRIIIRDNGCPNNMQYWIMNKIIIPFYKNICRGLGDVHYYKKEEMQDFCDRYGFVLEKFISPTENKIHCVLRNNVNI